MRLYHFTSARHLRAIGLHGLTVGDVPTDLALNQGQCGVWLTSDDNPEDQGLEGNEANKKQFRLTVDAPDNELLVRWIDWAPKNVTSDTMRGLHGVASGFNSWYVYFGVIDRSAIINCVEMQTGREVKNWADWPRSRSDVKPVPPWRRAAWQKKLLKHVAKELGAEGIKLPRPPATKRNTEMKSLAKVGKQASCIYDEWTPQYARLYNESIKLLDGTLAPIERLIRHGDVVVGVWADPNKPCGIDRIPLKGNRLLREMMAGERECRDVRITVVPCRSYEHAIEVKEKLVGEHDLDA
jgi:hypothetical protein